MELAAHDPFYEDMAIKFAEHFLWIAHAMNQTGPEGMWDEEDGFYYDVLRLPDGSARRLKVRSMVGLLPLCATTVIEPWQRERVPRVAKILRERLQRMPELRDSIHATGPGHFGYGERGIAALVNEDRLRRILTRMLDENEFLSPYGIRALSRYPCRPSLRRQRRRPGIPGELSSGRVRHRHVRRQLQLARPSLDASECAADSRVAVRSIFITATTSRSSAPPARAS